MMFSVRHRDARWLEPVGQVFAVLVLGAAAVAVGCSSSDSGSAAATTTRPPNTTTTAPGGEATATTNASTVSVTLTPIGSSPSCDEATGARTPDALLSAFRAARVHGAGAEHCLTAQALAAYCTALHPCSDEFRKSPGPICLYDCGGYRVKNMTFDVTQASDGTFSVYVEVDAQPAGTSGAPRDYPASTHESLTIGPGKPSNSPRTAPLVIVQATTSA
jgi:hypothetical protein